MRSGWFDEVGGAYLNDGRRAVARLIPVPNEAEAVYRQCGVPRRGGLAEEVSDQVLHNLRTAFGHISRWGGGNVVVSKRTANNRRISILRAAFPRAKYLVLLRDGRAVAHSLTRVHWWNDHVLFWAGRTPEQMVAEGSNHLALAARNWLEEMKEIEKGVRDLDEAEVQYIRYEDLIVRTWDVLQTALTFVGCPPAQYSPYSRFVRDLGIASKSERWQRDWSADELRAVEGIQGAMLEKVGYALKGDGQLVGSA
jgi:hypothetical protein